MIVDDFFEEKKNKKYGNKGFNVIGLQLLYFGIYLCIDKLLQ